ncbi:hypothetical protein TSUD_285580 [Trifolium subterraneum]|uniref:Uncharacterized protein n=1 Tax=Trifolium subterraneum TaxID=3900 RepID=A0A2Z6NHM2_TRISU|nr:hypothetical protein TSUD_285580 [Trifolium subterraneum]
MCYYYPDAAKLGGAIMAGEGSTSAPNAGRWQYMNLLRLLSLVLDHLLTTALRQGQELPPRLDL